MAGHIQFGARTGGAHVILGVVLLHHGASVQWVRCDAHAAVSGAYPRRDLFLTGAQLALSGSDLSQDRGERFVTFITAALAVWNVGIASWWASPRIGFSA